MVPQEGNSNTPCFLIPAFQGAIKPPAMLAVVDFATVFSMQGRLSFIVSWSNHERKVCPSTHLQAQDLERTDGFLFSKGVFL